MMPELTGFQWLIYVIVVFGSGVLWHFGANVGDDLYNALFHRDDNDGHD